nr:MAG TPA: hypothetical protein [Caudoviricetes sp.]
MTNSMSCSSKNKNCDNRARQLNDRLPISISIVRDGH